MRPPETFGPPGSPERGSGGTGGERPREARGGLGPRRCRAGAALLPARLSTGPLDDTDLALQRPGILDADRAPSPAPRLGGEISEPGVRAVVFFVRPMQLGRLRRALAEDRTLARAARLAVVVSGETSLRPPPKALLVVDRLRAFASGFGMRAPRDHGPPVGYAIVDRSGLVRYRTLDPGVAQRLGEVKTMLRDTP